MPYERPQRTSGGFIIGILSIPLGWFVPVLGIIMAIIAIYMGKDGQKLGLPMADATVKLGLLGLFVSFVSLAIDLILLLGET